LIASAVAHRPGTTGRPRRGRGLSDAEIGRELAMSEATVKAHISHALAKLGLTNRVQAAIFVHDANLGTR
jgi:DNA-binding NarL/FixJ family response regulator